MVPGAIPRLFVFAALGLADAILVEASLSFLGLGVPPFQPSWGDMLIDGQVGVLGGQWWIAVCPGLAALITAAAINFVGDGLLDVVTRE